VRTHHCHPKELRHNPKFRSHLAEMDFFKRILTLVGLLDRPPPRPDVLQFSSLRNLPTEILLQILDFLPPESAASFALCCEPLYSALKSRYLDCLGPTTWRRERLLQLLERDLPNHIVCASCQKLHAMKKAPRYLHSNSDYFHHLKCWKLDYSALTSLYIHEEFSSTIFKMTMKRYRNESDFSDLLGLLSLKTRTYCRHGYVEQRTAAAKIIDGRLLIREQKRFMIPTTQSIPFPWDANFVICPHISFWSTRDLGRYFRNLPATDWKLWAGRTDRERMRQCKYCWSEYRIDFKQFGVRGNAMYVTKWLDLGQGPSGYRYRSHVSCRDALLWLEIKFDSGSICATFEGREQFDFDGDPIISLKDRKELFKRSMFSWPKHL